jgi:hypothetical protein
VTDSRPPEHARRPLARARTAPPEGETTPRPAPISFPYVGGRRNAVKVSSYPPPSVRRVNPISTTLFPPSPGPLEPKAIQVCSETTKAGRTTIQAVRTRAVEAPKRSAATKPSWQFHCSVQAS